MTAYHRIAPVAGTKDPLVEASRERMAAILKHALDGAGERATSVPGLTIHGRETPAEPTSFLYEPSFAFIIRGAKRVVLGGDTFVYDESHFLLTAIGLPTIVQVIDASAEHPYYSIKWNIDLDIARALIAEAGHHAPPATTAMSVGPVTPALTNAVMRLVDLIAHPEEASILAASLHREILYRVLTSPVGGRLREAVELGTETNRVAAAIRHIRDHFKRPIRIEDLADITAMGVSTLHHHFRALTAMSPLQYQKQLRLHEARHLMLQDRIDAGTAAHSVGYESTTQFNREYRRLFGTPPKRDVRSILEG